MTTFLLLLKCFFWSILSTLLRVVLPSVTILLLKYSFKILFTPLLVFLWENHESMLGGKLDFKVIT